MSKEELSKYDKLKYLILKEFQPMPQECYNFCAQQKLLSSESYMQFMSRLKGTFQYYCQLRNVNDFKSVCELIVSDKMFNTLDKDLMTHISVKQGETFLKPHELGRECDIYLSSKGKIKNEYYTFSKYVPGNENNVLMQINNKGIIMYEVREEFLKYFFFKSKVKNVLCVKIIKFMFHFFYTKYISCHSNFLIWLKKKSILITDK